MHEPTQVVVLGGGYTAVWAARALARGLRRRLRDGSVRVTVVSSSTTHAFHGWTGEVLSGHVRGERARTALVDLVPAAWVLHGCATALDTVTRTVAVTTDEGVRLLPYHHLLVATGSRDARERVPGLAEHGWSLKDDGGLDALVGRLDGGAGPAVVVGGGLAGTEAAVAMAARLRREDPEARVVLVHGGDRVLPELRPRFERVARYALEQAGRAGVDVRCGARVVRVDDGVVVLDDGSTIPAGTVVSAVGQRVVTLPGLAADRAADGRLVTDRLLRTSIDGVWAGGDGAAVPQPNGSGPCPPNALWALKAGTRVGRNIARTVRGRPARAFRFPGLGQAASLGVGRGAAELYGVQLTGWAAWLTRWVFFHAFMPSRRVALAAMGDWLVLGLRTLGGRRAVAHATRGAVSNTGTLDAAV
ncbi:NAD(P)/FAD-dependent oxidoreductase [Cellulomonas sp. PhB150]|uniref:NAD(P)/FAD-dependent oxidoreductase n=1 Tax=Cellulomonas sp. PhB150 TaxID=2485188 RepID=UPI0013153D0F|nr:FAD-dependent oxidoreductase [Cellulomonas sp. PhB150]